MFGANFGLIIGVCFSYPNFEAVKPHLNVIRDGFIMEGSITYVSTFDAAFDDAFGESFATSGYGVFSFINTITSRVSL